MASLTLCKSIIAPRLAAAPPSVLMAQKTRQPSTSVLRSLTASRASALLLMGASMVYPKRQLREGKGGVKKVMVMASEEEGVVEEEEEEEEEGSGFEEKIEENEFAEYPEEAKLFVGNLPLDVDNQQLGELFEAAGEVVDVNIILDRETGSSRGFGFVAMATVEEANKGIEKFNQYTFRGRLLTVNTASPRGSRPERPNQTGSVHRVYVGNLPWQADDNSLLQLFSEHGKVLEAKVVYDRETGRSRGFGFVTFSSENELNDAIAALDGADMDGRPLRVNMAEDRPRRRF